MAASRIAHIERRKLAQLQPNLDHKPAMSTCIRGLRRSLEEFVGLFGITGLGLVGEGHGKRNFRL